jgi:hypothetical protein
MAAPRTDCPGHGMSASWATSARVTAALTVSTEAASCGLAAHRRLADAAESLRHTDGWVVLPHPVLVQAVEAILARKASS